MKGPEAFRTISEAAAELGVPQHVLRFWETKFSFIRPMKRAGGRRFYRRQDLDLLKGVRTLLHDEGYTIKGVQRLHKEMGVRRLLAAGGPVDPGALAALEAPETAEVLLGAGTGAPAAEALEPQLPFHLPDPEAPGEPAARLDVHSDKLRPDQEAAAGSVEGGVPAEPVADPIPESAPESASETASGTAPGASPGTSAEMRAAAADGLWDEDDPAGVLDLEFEPAAPGPSNDLIFGMPGVRVIRADAREADAAASLEILRASARPPDPAAPREAPERAEDLFEGEPPARHVLDEHARARLQVVLADLEGVKARLDRVISPDLDP